MGQNEEYHPTVDSWSEKDSKIIVKTPPGLMADLIMHAKVDASPSVIWDILTHEQPQKIFKGIKDVTYRIVTEDDGKGKRTLKVGHRSYVKFLFIQVTFDTDLLVWEDRAAGKIHFQNASETFMKFFDGKWTVQPFTQAALDRTFSHEGDAPPPQSSWWDGANILSRLAGNVAPEADSCLVTLEQQILPKAIPPQGIRQLVTRMCAGTLRMMMEDLRREASKVKQGTPTLADAPSKGNNATAAASITASALDQPLSLDRWIQPVNIVIKL